MGPAITIGVVVVFVIGIVLAIQYQRKKERERTEAFAAVANELSFEFLPTDQPTLTASLGHFHLFSQGHSKYLWNLLRGSAFGLELSIFDYRYITGSGKHQSTWVQSVFCARKPGMNLPVFCLRPESIWHKIGAWLGASDINFDSHPEFSRKYLLKGPDEAAIRKSFTTSVLNALDPTAGLSIEANGDTMVFYKYVRLEPAHVSAFMGEGLEMLKLFAPDAMAVENS